MAVRSQTGQIVCETLSQKKKKTHHNKRAGGVAQGVDCEFKPQFYKKEEVAKKTADNPIA
jgi:hypothetical protein